jgi:hypothetical protein
MQVTRSVYPCGWLRSIAAGGSFRNTGPHEVVRPGGARKLNGEQEAHLVALACSTPPQGRGEWTMQLLADRLVTLGIVAAISDETVRRTLKRGASNRGSINSGASRR